MKVTEVYVYFWGGFLSNWHVCPIDAEIEGRKVHFTSSEQYFMYMKAITFHDNDVAEAILINGTDPKIAKELGRKVYPYDDKVWNAVRYDIMKEAVYQKFKQNETLKEELMSDTYDGKHFVEGSPYDGIWGIKCHWKDALDDKSNWNGENLLGKALDEARERIAIEEDYVEYKPTEKPSHSFKRK